jgi:3-oxoacyl-[acyl-carrier-protein] synthase-3
VPVFSARRCRRSPAGYVLLNLQHAIEQGELPDGAAAVVLNASPSAAWSVLLVENSEPSHGAHYL